MIIERSDIQNIYPLTPLQEGIYFHAESAPSSEAYFEQWSLRIHGELRPDLVRSVWNDLFARHEVFRAVFTPGDGKRPLQIVLKRREVELSIEDLSELESAEQVACLAAVRERDRARGFALGADPLVRLIAVRLADREWELVWSHHHIILDGWSVALVQAEFMRRYAAARAGREAPLEVAPPFSAFVKSLPAATDSAFWSAYLAGCESAPDLPRVWAARPSGMARELVELSAESSARVEAFCRETGVTLGSFVQAVWTIVLARYAYSDDVVFGWVVSGRTAHLPGVEKTIGLLINTLPVRIRLEAEETFRELVARVQREAAELVAHHLTPLAEIQRAGGFGPLFTHVLAVENYPVEEELRATSLAETGFEVRAATSYDRTEYGFDLVVLPGPERLRFRLSWDRAAYDDDLMVRLGAQLQHVIEAVTEQPELRPCRLNILPPDQWELAVRRPNRTAARYPAHETIVDAFERQAALHAASPAVLAPHASERWWTYEELRARAQAVAAHLRHDLQLPAGSRVALYAPPSAAAVAAVLGILKAGGTYVPIDPRYPRERVEFLLEDCGAAALLVQRGEGVEPPPASVPVVDLDALPAEDARSVASLAGPDDTAYVIYTSGSTGTPKGCCVTHRNVVRLILNEGLDLSLGANDVWVVAHSMSFDFSIWEIFGALLRGARLVVPASATVQDPTAFRELLSRHRVTVLNQTPLAFRNLIAIEEEAAEHELGDHLRYVIFGGDRLDVEALQPWVRCYPLESCALINMYGITETTVHVTMHRLTEEQIFAPPPQSPLGRPLPETTVYLCDRHLNPQPLGAPGEMLVGGSGVCNGYLGRPELTAQRFLPDTFAGSGTLYRSGDLACRDAAGELYFVGRNDRQVKIRGHRIEPAEVERALRRCEGVSDAAVITEPGPAGAELIACVSGRADPERLRDQLATVLPAYALPGSILLCASLPLTANGKLDHAAVQALRQERAGAVAGETFEAPANAREQILAEVWAAVLGLSRVGRRDRYLSLGGDSIKSIQILAQLRARGLTLELRDLFRYPTIAELAPALTERKAAAARAESSAPFALTPIQARFFEMHTVERGHFNHALLLRCERSVEPSGLRRALQRLSDAHGALRLRFEEGPAGAWRQRFAARGEPVALDVVDVAGEPDEAAAIRHHSAALQAGYDLGAGPLFRTALYRGAHHDQLLLVAHHLCVDGVSWQILLEDLSALLSGAVALEATDSFAHWAATLGDGELRRRLRAAEELLWRQLDEAPAGGWEPPFEAGTYADAQESTIEFDVAETAEIVHRANAAYQTNAAELVLVAVARALGRWTGRRRVQIALEGHGRDGVPGSDVSRTVGWFTALYPFHLDLDDGPASLRIRRLKEELRRIPSGGAGYGVLRYPAGGDSPGPLTARPSVSFNYLGEFHRPRPDGWFAPSSTPIAPPVSPRGPRPFAIEIAALVLAGSLRIAVTYPAGGLAEASAGTLLRALEEELRVVVNHCLGREAPELTPADLTYKDLSLDEFDRLFDED